MKRLILGTAQFGMDYGINNVRGKIPRQEAIEILRTAVENGVDRVDTAPTYGESETVLGEFIAANKGHVRVISKLARCAADRVKDVVSVSLDRLSLDRLYGYLIHDFKHYQEDPRVWTALQKLRAAGKVEKIGFSLYYPEELKYLLDRDVDCDLVQVPLNVFDQRFIPFLDVLRKREIEVHARSVFLQGLLFKDPEELDEYFSGCAQRLRSLRSLSRDTAFSLETLCLGFVLQHNALDAAVVGVDGIGHFERILATLPDMPKAASLAEKLKPLRHDDESVIVPFRWPKKKAGV